MPVLGIIQKYKLLFSVIALLGIIVIIFLSIIFIDRHNFSSTVTPQYKESVNNLENKLYTLAKTNSQTDNGRFQKIIVSLDTLKQDNLSDKDKYTALQQSLDYYYAWYRNNNIHSLYTNSHIIEDFAKEFFPSFYNEKDFLIQCQDPQCATTQQPADVDKIIADVQASDFPAEVKATVIQDLKDDGYFQNADDRARNYLESAKIISRYGYYSPSGEHQKISDNIVTFVQNNYPNEYLKYKSIINQ